MIYKWLISVAVKILLRALIIGVGVWYLWSCFNGGASLSYVSADTFMQQISSASGDCDVPGCFLCCYVKELFVVMGKATGLFWDKIVGNLWVLMAVGFGIFIIFHTIKMLHEQATSEDVKDLKQGAEPKIDFWKWFDKVWRTGVRVLIIGGLLGVLNAGGTGVLRTVTNVTVTPVMYLGSMLSMAATGVISHQSCDISKPTESDEDIFNPVLQPFMCVIGNLNTVMLAGAGGGFALYQYGWLEAYETGGGQLLSITGIALVVMFLIIGFDLLFQILTVFLKLVFIIIFMPLLLASVAFEQVWGLAKGLMNKSVEILVNSAISILKISLKVCITYAIVFFAADTFYPGPTDGFTSILPPLLSNMSPQNLDAQTLSVMNAFSTCERESLVNGEMDRRAYARCFREQRTIVEAQYPGAFDFMSDAFDFLLFMIGIYCLYFWVISPKIDGIFAKDAKEEFDYGQWVKDVGKTTYQAPGKIYKYAKGAIKKGK